MRSKPPDELEQGRITIGPYGSPTGSGWPGAFAVRGPHGWTLLLIVANGMGWEHASVSVPPPNPNVKQRDPHWDEMCFVKDLVWEPEEVVVQYHPRKSEYINTHPHVLHLWRQVGLDFITPPPILVGFIKKG